MQLVSTRNPSLENSFLGAVLGLHFFRLLCFDRFLSHNYSLTLRVKRRPIFTPIWGSGRRRPCEAGQAGIEPTTFRFGDGHSA